MSENKPNLSPSELLKDFFLPTSQTPIEDTLEVLRQQMMAQGKAALDRGINGVASILNGVYTVLDYQGRELTLLKILEAYIRRGTLDDDKLAEIMGNLNKFREESRSKMEELTKNNQG